MGADWPKRSPSYLCWIALPQLPGCQSQYIEIELQELNLNFDKLNLNCEN